MRRRKKKSGRRSQSNPIFITMYRLLQVLGCLVFMAVTVDSIPVNEFYPDVKPSFPHVAGGDIRRPLRGGLPGGSTKTSEFQSLLYTRVEPMQNNSEVCHNKSSTVFRLNFIKLTNLEQFLTNKSNNTIYAFKSTNSNQDSYFIFDTAFQRLKAESGITNFSYVVLCAPPPKSKVVVITLAVVGAVAVCVLGFILYRKYFPRNDFYEKL